VKGKFIFGVLIFFAVVFIYITFSYHVFSIKKTDNSATVLTAVATTTPDTKKIKILIVPGHEPGFGGAWYRGLKEEDLTLLLAKKIQGILKNDPRLDVIMSRDDGGWDYDIANYIATNKTQIENWVNEHKNKTQNTQMYDKQKLLHIPLTLYGTNKWADENGIDIILNIHFNSNPKIIGQQRYYKGFTIYTTSQKSSNSTSSKIFAKDIMNELLKIENKSNAPKEATGIVVDQDFIAIGSNNTLNAPSIIVEYAYIYENFMQATSTRNNFFDKAASSTATAINNYIENGLKK